jgi:dienelactone hydrolase
MPRAPKGTAVGYGHGVDKLRLDTLLISGPVLTFYADHFHRVVPDDRKSIISAANDRLDNLLEPLIALMRLVCVLLMPSISWRYGRSSPSILTGCIR